MSLIEVRHGARAFVGLGSNLGEPQIRIEQALLSLAAARETRLLRRSRLFHTAPWGIAEQPAFVNAVAELATGLAPRDLLDAMLEIERMHGRQREGSRWGPRTLDLDLLVYDGVISNEPGLTLPHPRIAERAFVLVPLAEIAADLAIPGLGRVLDLLARVDTRDCIPIEATLPVEPDGRGGE